MASNVAVIGSTCGAIPEVIGDAGLVFAEGDATALAEALRRMLCDTALRERCAIRGRKRVEENFSWEVVARKTFEFFQQVLAGRSVSDSNLDFERQPRTQVRAVSRESENAAA